MSEKNYISNRRVGIASPRNKHGWATRLIAALISTAKRTVLGIFRQHMGHAIVAEGFLSVFSPSNDKVFSARRSKAYEDQDIAAMPDLVFMKVFIDISSGFGDEKSLDMTVKISVSNTKRFLKNTDSVFC